VKWCRCIAMRQSGVCGSSAFDGLFGVFAICSDRLLVSFSENLLPLCPWLAFEQSKKRYTTDASQPNLSITLTYYIAHGECNMQ
jgi:hypothetical protein